MLPVFSDTDQSHSTPRCAEIQPLSQQAAAATRPYRGLVLDTRAPPVACPSRGNRAMQTIIIIIIIIIINTRPYSQNTGSSL